MVLKTNILDEGSHIVEDMIESILHRLDLLQLSAEDLSELVWDHQELLTEKRALIGAYNLNWKTLQPVKDKIEKAMGFLSILTTMLTLPLWRTLDRCWREPA